MDDDRLHPDNVESVDLDEVEEIKPYNDVYSYVPTATLKAMLNEIRFWRAQWKRGPGAH